jgi:glycosyltransferase involved in cell wall biosynthesis
MKPMKLLFTIPSLINGGTQQVLVQLVNRLDKNKYEILLVLFENIMDYKKELEPSINIAYLNKKNKWDIFNLIIKLRKVIFSYKPDVVISLSHYANIVTALPTLFSKKEFKFIVCEHGYSPKYLPDIGLKHLRKYLMNLSYKKADKIVAVSKAIKEVLEKSFNIKSEKVEVIHNPIFLEEIRNKCQEEVEHPFFKNKNVQVIISAGRLSKEKRLDRLLKAFALLRKGQENVRLIILGKGRMWKELEVLASRLSISKYVDFVGFQSNPYAWISKANIFVLSSDHEGFPMALLEAMTCGTSVISTDCPSGPGEIITNGKNGILVPPANEGALAEAMLDLVSDEEKRKRFSEAAKKRVQEFGVDKIVKQYRELF